MKKLISIKQVEQFDIYDITVENDHCFELANGVVAHNSLFPKDIVGGGCMVAGTKIQMADGTLRNIEDVVVGDYVRTMRENEMVTATWNPTTLVEGEPECYEVEFEDGSKYICSDQHMFMRDGEWVEVTQLGVGDEVSVV